MGSASWHHEPFNYFLITVSIRKISFFLFVLISTNTSILQMSNIFPGCVRYRENFTEIRCASLNDFADTSETRKKIIFWNISCGSIALRVSSDFVIIIRKSKTFRKDMYCLMKKARKFFPYSL
jgi:hypothetical protein